MFNPAICKVFSKLLDKYAFICWYFVVWQAKQHMKWGNKMSEKETKKGIGYCRVSTEGQEENTSLEEQESRIKAFAFSQGIELLAVFSDALSGGNTDRQGYQDALAYLKENRVDCFIVAKFDRAHRHQENLLVFERELRERGIAFLSVAELIDSSTPTGKLMFQILGSFAEFEKNQINERTRGGRKARLNNSEYAGGRPPLGYNKEWKVVPEEAETVKGMFIAYMREGSLGKVQVLYPSFSRQALHWILTNRVYLGEYAYDGPKEHNGVVVKGRHEAIISQVTFGKVQAALARNRRS
jgi:site-specific DNA recombinase